MATLDTIQTLFKLTYPGNVQILVYFHSGKLHGSLRVLEQWFGQTNLSMLGHFVDGQLGQYYKTCFAVKLKLLLYFQARFKAKMRLQHQIEKFLVLQSPLAGTNMSRCKFIDHPKSCLNFSPFVIWQNSFAVLVPGRTRVETFRRKRISCHSESRTLGTGNLHLSRCQC